MTENFVFKFMWNIFNFKNKQARYDGKFYFQIYVKYFNFKNKIARYDGKCMSVLMQSTRYSCQILMKLEYSRQIFE